MLIKKTETLIYLDNVLPEPAQKVKTKPAKKEASSSEKEIEYLLNLLQKMKEYRSSRR